MTQTESITIVNGVKVPTANITHAFEKRKAQSIGRKYLNQLESELDATLTEQVTARLGLDYSDSQIVHYSHQLKKQGNHKLKGSNGFTLLVLRGNDDGSCYVISAICGKNDNFDKLQGRIIAKQRLSDILEQEEITLEKKFYLSEAIAKSNVIAQNLLGNYVKVSKDNVGFSTGGLTFVRSNTATEARIAIAHFIKEVINKNKPVVVKPVPVIEPFNEIRSLAEAYATMHKRFQPAVDKGAVLSHQFVHLRFFHTSAGMQLVTNSFLRNSGISAEIINECLQEKGGITILAFTLTLNEQTFVFGSMAQCSYDDNFSKALGRQYAIKAAINKSDDGFGYESEVDEKEMFSELIGNLSNGFNLNILS